MPERADVFGIDAILCGVGANPANRTLHVVKLRGPAILLSGEQSVIHGESDEPGAREEPSHPAHGALVEAGPSATVDENDGGMQLHTVGRFVYIEPKGRIFLRSVD